MHGIRSLACLLIIVCLTSGQQAQDAQPLSIIVLRETEQSDVATIMSGILRSIDKSRSVKLREHFVVVDHDDEEATQKILCELLNTGPVHAVLDITYSRLHSATATLAAARIAHFRLDITNRPFVAAATRWLHARDATDAIIVLAGERELTESLYELMQNSVLRVIAFAGLSAQTAQKIQRIRPIPTYSMALAAGQTMLDIVDVAARHQLLQRADTWNVMLLDFDEASADALRRQNAAISVLQPTRGMCCRLLGIVGEAQCSCSASEAIAVDATVLRAFLDFLLDGLLASDAAKATPTYQCPSEIDLEVVVEQSPALFTQVMQEIAAKPAGLLRLVADETDAEAISYHVQLTAWTANMSLPNPVSVAIALVDQDNVTALPSSSDPTEMATIPRSRIYYRVGITEAVPWTYARRDPRSGETVLTADGQPIWEGYCIDMIAKIAEILDFDYELVPAVRGTFGDRLPDNSWDGMVGDLVTGETDIAVGALKMTAEREEVIDFIPPYFEQSGILIAIRNPVRQTSLFKFMTVLRLEVWLSIVAALFATAIMIWLLDKYSPYSARNNREAYPYPCREFTLKESFWFALTSFTPQGGGEAPKSLSGRTMVSAYWLFVVLMLATFTANLAAFLTVERMQTPVQSLEQLARQSRINYTVVAGSDTHQYFRNMKFAEDTLYRVWKEITLNSTHDQAKYRVWEYPIREQYGQILMAIEAAQPVLSAADGFRQVNEHENADYAFIHDSAEIKYEISRNCNLTEVGEVFAEQPYAIGIQQGSNLQDDLTRTVLRLQRERFFDDLTAKFWNHSAKGQCVNSDDSEGITLESLGGVFIATLFGLALSMVTLVGEVLYYRRRRARTGDVVMVKPVPGGGSAASTRELVAGEAEEGGGGDGEAEARRVTIGHEFVAAADRRRNLAYISIFPRRALHEDYGGDSLKVD